MIRSIVQRNDVNQWIQVDLHAAFKVTGVITQGRNQYYNQWVTSYQISYSIDGQDWTLVEDSVEGPRVRLLKHHSGPTIKI